MARIRRHGLGFTLVEPEAESVSIDVMAGRIEPADAHALAIARAQKRAAVANDLADYDAIAALLERAGKPP